MLCERPDKLILALLESDDELKLQVAKCRAVLDQETNPPTIAQLAAAPVGHQKRMIGEKLYVQIEKLGVANPTTVTGIILKLHNDVLMNLLPGGSSATRGEHTEQAKEELRKCVAEAERMISSCPETWPFALGDRDYKAPPAPAPPATPTDHPMDTQQTVQHQQQMDALESRTMEDIAENLKRKVNNNSPLVATDRQHLKDMNERLETLLDKKRSKQTPRDPKHTSTGLIPVNI